MINIAFFGTGEFSKNILSDLISNSKINVTLAVSQPDKPVGRKKIITPTPVKIIAEENNIPVLQPEKLRNNTEFFAALQNGNFDFIVVVAYGKIVPNEVLEAAKHGCINIHGSILPAYRGASPIQESIKNGDTETGLTIMYMSEGMDEGDILQIEKVKIDILDKTPNIFAKFENIGASLLIDSLEKILSGDISGIPQNETEATYCSKIEKTNGEVNFQTNTGSNIYNTYRAYTPWPGIYSYYNDKKITIEECSFIETPPNPLQEGEVISLPTKEIGIVCSDGILILKQVKLEGKKSMDILSFINGNKDFLDYNFS